MRRKGSRLLTPGEMNLWERVTQRTRVLHPDRAKPATGEMPHSEPNRNGSERPVQFPIPEFRIGERSGIGDPLNNVVPGVSRQAKTHPPRMDRKTYDRMRRGKLVPEARIDLHGMTTARALPELQRFVQRAHDTGCRLVLVITGKGRNSGGDELTPEREGVLKRQVPRWLSASPLSQLVLEVFEAHTRHGGSGAYYVYLRRRK